MARSLPEIARRVVRMLHVTAANKAASKLPANKAKKTKRPKPLPARSGMTMQELLDSATKDRIGNAKRDKVTIVAFRVGGKPKDSVIFSRSLTYDRSRIPVQVRPHKHWIRKVKDEANLRKPFSKAKLHLHCDCEDWVFTWEYALTHHGASTIKYSNGDPPVVRNPRLHPGVCKHLWTLLSYLKKQKL